MPLYEHVLIARQDISTQQVDEIVAGLTKEIEDAGGLVRKTEYWGLRNLAYRIAKNRKGHYALIAMQAPPSLIAEMERKLRINEDVLRYMTTKIDEITEEPSPVVSKRSERGEREGGREGGRDGGPRFDRGDRGDRGGDRGDRGPRGPRREF